MTWRWLCFWRRMPDPRIDLIARRQAALAILVKLYGEKIMAANTKLQQAIQDALTTDTNAQGVIADLKQKLADAQAANADLQSQLANAMTAGEGDAAAEQLAAGTKALNDALTPPTT
jgi:hypothetical protein